MLRKILYCLKCQDKNVLSYCHCGCNETLFLKDSTNRIRSHILGHHRRNKKATLGEYDNRSGNKSIKWQGGIRKTWNGYIIEIRKGHPRSDRDGYVRQHILVMEKHLNRFLEGYEVVHHKDGNRQNNKIENLELFNSQGEHLKHHKLLRSFSTII